MPLGCCSWTSTCLTPLMPLTPHLPMVSQLDVGGSVRVHKRSTLSTASLAAAWLHWFNEVQAEADRKLCGQRWFR